MLFNKPLTLAALASTALAQNTPTLEQALNSTSDLSQLKQLLSTNPQLGATLGAAKNITILAPSNQAFGRVNNATLSGLLADPSLLAGLLTYHVLNGTYRAEAVTNNSAFLPSLLSAPAYANVTGGQRVRAQLVDSKVTFFSGLQDNSTVTTGNVNFTGGVIHIIDHVLTVPLTASDTLSAAGLTSLRGALNATSLVSTVNTTPNVTIFAPTNAALQAIGGGLANLTSEQIKDVLTYHVIAGTVGYSSGLKNGTVLKAVNGKDLTVTINDGKVFVNSARVVTADVLIANGVVHVIDAVLNPTNATIANPSAQSGAAAFSGAASASEAPFTSGQPTPTRSIAPQGTSPASTPAGSSSARSSGGAAPMQTGAVGLGALLGAAAVYFM